MKIASMMKRVRDVLAPSPTAPEIIVAATRWTVNGVNVFSANLVRGLVSSGVPAHVLLTEEFTHLINDTQSPLPWPADVPFEYLPTNAWDGWGAHWGTMIRYLERRAPCIYIPNSDYRHSGVAPRLSDRVVIVGVVHSDDPLHYAHVARLGRYWNAIVCVSQVIAKKVIAQNPAFEPRVSVIPIGVHVPPGGVVSRPDSGVLRVIYHGILKQHQKNVLDLPRIAAAAVARGVPLQLTIIGSGPDEDELKRRAQPLVERGVIRFMGAMGHSELMASLEQQDVFVLPSEFEGMPNALLESMARGCVPLASRMESGVPDVVTDGVSGFLQPFGDVDAFAERLAELSADRALLARMSDASHRAVIDGGFGVTDMVASYQAVFARAASDAAAGRFVRPREPLSPAPAMVGEVSIFPVPLPHPVEGVGSFPSGRDAEDYEWAQERVFEPRVPLDVAPGQTRVARSGSKLLQDVRVVVAAPVWTRNGRNLVSEDLVRGLQRAGIDSRLLLTEENTPLVTIDEPRMPRPTDIPVEELTVRGADSWGARWGAMQRYLESRRPAIYLPGFDWRHACVIPRLDTRVCVAGLLDAFDPLLVEQTQRLGRFWNATVCLNRAGRDLVADRSAMVAEIAVGYDIPHDMVPHARTATLRVLLVNNQAAARDDDAWPSVTAALSRHSMSRTTRVTDPPHTSWPALCDAHDVVVLRGSGSDDRRYVTEAMARGCVVVTTFGLDEELLKHEANGFVLASVATPELVALIDRLAGDDALWHGVSAAAQTNARRNGVNRTSVMVDQYLNLFEQMRSQVVRGTFRRARGPILPPPPRVGEIDVFPLPLPYVARSGDRFGSRREYMAWLLEKSAVPTRMSR